MKILIVEDEARVAKLLRSALSEDGHDVDIAVDGEAGEKLGVSGNYDLLVLDWLLPKQDGLTICRRVRETGSKCPILMLTAKDAVRDRVEGLDSGADDYLVKPFAMAELLARVRALLRRGTNQQELSLRVGDVSLDLLTRCVTADGINIGLTDREFCLLEYLMRNKGQTVSRSMIADNAWGSSADASTNAVDVYVNFLRSKSDVLRGLIKTVKGEGYRVSDSS